MTHQAETTLEQQLTEWAREVFIQAFGASLPAAFVPEVTISTNEKFGDYQCNSAMGLAKVLKQKPRDIAEAFVQQARPPAMIDHIELAGPGFINITLNAGRLADTLMQRLRNADYGLPSEGTGRTMILDYSSPNVAKPMHIGHIRSTVIGNALDRMHRCLGWKVISDNHLGDWGTQFGLLILGYRHFADRAALETKPVEELERIYVASYEKAEADPAWREEAKRELVKLQQGDEDHRRLWKHFIELSLEEFDRIYRRLGVSFDLHRGESYYHELLGPLVAELSDADIAEESEGALIVRFAEDEMPPCIIRKSDGGYNYATTDLATVKSRMEEFKPDRIVYVTDERQQLHFRQFFDVCARMEWDVDLKHIWFGLMRLPEGTFSTRQGNVIKLERMLDEAESRALNMVQQSSPDMPPDQQSEVARAVGLGAVKYADLSQNPQSMVTFSWDKALSLEGNSAPYLQYAHARICSVLQKYASAYPDVELESCEVVLRVDIERRVALHLIRYPDTVVKAARLFRPNIIADYLYELAQLYSSFYQNVPFLKAEEGVRESRLQLCRAVAGTLRHGLDLLGIEAPERI